MHGKADSLVLGMGNDAIARGALEGNVNFATAYPGTPSSEILQNLASITREWDIYVEWSTNEKVAFEAALAAAWSGLRAMTSMKQNGLFVLLDTLVNVAYTGHGSGGLVLVVADDPQAHSSTTEADTRFLGHYADIPVLEPSTHQEAKDMMPYAFDLSERYGIPFLIRITTRLAHSQQAFRLGPVLRQPRTAKFDHSRPLLNIPLPHLHHAELHNRLEQLRERFEVSPWNRYSGPEQPDLLIITAGTGWLYANEAVRFLNLHEQVGILRIATLSPLPFRFISQSLSHASKVLFLEEIDPYLETLVRANIYDLDSDLRPTCFGKLTGHIPKWGELTIDTTLQAIADITGKTYSPVSSDFRDRINEIISDIPPRTLTFCAGCPHRAAYYAIYKAIKKNQNKGFVTGDIGCYSLGAFYHDLMRNQHAMGTGLGLASGFGKLQPFGLDEPVIAVIGDSTLFHAGLPALVNVYYNQANATICILDNGTTAMTGFQPHPGTGQNASGEPAPVLELKQLISSLGIENVTVIDPYKIDQSIQAVYHALTTKEANVIIFRHQCPFAISQPKLLEKPLSVPRIDSGKCRGNKCGLCYTEFNCPAIIWDSKLESVQIDSLQCIGCNVCIQICPHQAIISTQDRNEEEAE
jgi:indolepyruvate ferredoxin oxidoreductase alpha subunit